MRISETVERLAYEGTDYDAHGNKVDSWAEPVTLAGKFRFDPGSSSEPRREGLERVIVEPTLYGPYSMPFLPQDKCRVQGKTYQVEGEVRRWSDRADDDFGAVVTLRRVDG